MGAPGGGKLARGRPHAGCGAGGGIVPGPRRSRADTAAVRRGTAAECGRGRMARARRRLPSPARWASGPGRSLSGRIRQRPGRGGARPPSGLGGPGQATAGGRWSPCAGLWSSTGQDRASDPRRVSGRRRLPRRASRLDTAQVSDVKASAVAVVVTRLEYLHFLVIGPIHQPVLVVDPA